MNTSTDLNQRDDKADLAKRAMSLPSPVADCLPVQANTLPPRLLSLRDSARYCGLTSREFRPSVKVPPVWLGAHERWDRHQLDAYIDGLQGKRPSGLTRADIQADLAKF